MIKLIGIPRPERFFAPWEFVESLLNLKGEYQILSQPGVLIDRNRNQLVEIAKTINADWLLMVDTDMVFTKEQVEKLESHLKNGVDIVSGLCIRGNNKLPTTWKYQNGEYEHFDYGTNGLTEVDAVGGAFLMLSKKALQIENPFNFIGDLGEDLSFCKRAKEQGLKVYCDTSVKIGHIRQIII